MLKEQDSEITTLAEKAPKSDDENCSIFGQKCQVGDPFKVDAMFNSACDPTFLFVTRFLARMTLPFYL